MSSALWRHNHRRWNIAQLVRAGALYASGSGFESRCSDKTVLRESGTEYHRRSHKPEITGSTPVPATNDDVTKRPKEADCNSVIAGSNPAVVLKSNL